MKFKPGLTAVAALALLIGLAPADELDDAKARLQIEAQRVEKEFTEGRSAAYKLVRAGSPDYVGAFAKLQTLLTLLEEDKSLPAARRDQLLVTVKFDMGKVKEIADASRRASASGDLGKSIRTDVRRETQDRRGTEAKRTASEAESIITGRSRTVADARTRGKDYNDRVTRVLRSVDESAMPEAGDYVLPRDWAELSKRRLATSSVTPKERAILRALDTVIEADYADQTFSQVIEHLEKLTGLTFALDKRAIEEANVTYETPIKLKLKSSTRFVLRRMLGDLGLAYVIKDEGIFITSTARAREQTTVRRYYIGDLASAVDMRLGPVIAQAQMVETVNRMIAMITQTVEPRSWQANDPEGVGSIAFEPVTMSLIIKQTAEIHFRLGGGR